MGKGIGMDTGVGEGEKLSRDTRTGGGKVYRGEGRGAVQEWPQDGAPTWSRSASREDSNWVVAVATSASHCWRTRVTSCSLSRWAWVGGGVGCRAKRTRDT
jgi:hypothetical protein